MSLDFGPSVENFEISVLLGRKLEFSPTVAFATYFSASSDFFLILLPFYYVTLYVPYCVLHTFCYYTLSIAICLYS